VDVEPGIHLDRCDALEHSPSRQIHALRGSGRDDNASEPVAASRHRTEGPISQTSRMTCKVATTATENLSAGQSP
jgi:hypothetical protein